MINQYDNEIFEMKTYFEHPSGLLALLDTFGNQICETLDLLTKITLF